MLLYSALFVADVLLVGFIIANGPTGLGYVTVAIIGAVGLLLAFHIIQHVQDLGSPLVETEGVVRRKWRRADLFIVWYSYYIQVDRAIFKIAPEQFIHLDAEMSVKVVHFARTLSVISVEELARTHTPPPPPSTI